MNRAFDMRLWIKIRIKNAYKTWVGILWLILNGCVFTDSIFTEVIYENTIDKIREKKIKYEAEWMVVH